MKNIFDYSHVKSVTAIALIDITTRECRGKIVANWSDNPSGSVCTCQIFLDDSSGYLLRAKQLKYDSKLLQGSTYAKPMIGKAGGYGYDKISTAIYSALNERLPIDETRRRFAGAGLSEAEKFFKEKLNLEFITVIG